jgi:hypothetical protein
MPKDLTPHLLFIIITATVALFATLVWLLVIEPLRNRPKKPKIDD